MTNSEKMALGEGLLLEKRAPVRRQFFKAKGAACRGSVYAGLRT